ncbi:ATP-binding protein [Streptomyces prunicolor]|uniref:AAA family ATPase n=1 Tax=Streptomyces prunicolor TaxID=67348 RepID=UPI00386F10E1|nr:ATP-binding protein [Streptomyces prunicolor]
MLLSFRVANHRSIKEEQQLLLGPVYEADRPEGTDWEAVPVVAVFGANAAGKSNVVDALRYMEHMVRSSHRDAEPGAGTERFAFALDEECRAEPSWFVVDLSLDGVRHTYGFSLDDERVVDEWLYSYPHGRKRIVFQRAGEDFTFGDKQPRKELELVTKITEPNTLFMSVAARSRQEAVRPVYEWFTRGVWFRDGTRRAMRLNVVAGLLLSDPSRVPGVVGLLRAADLGIENVGVERVVADEMSGPVRSYVVGEAIADNSSGPASGMWTPQRETTQVWVQQRGRHGSVRLGLKDQSAGTKALLGYAGSVLDVLESGGLLVVDEIDSSLHPRLTAHLIKLFQDEATNPQGAQLLLTTHDASLLGRSGGEDILKRDQVWFVEKDGYGETTLYPLSDFKPRQEESRERRYLGGSYGAVPLLNEELFAAAVAVREGSGGEDPEE